MKSSYELAMERLEKSSGPTRRLTDEQKAAVATINQKYDARLAEVRLASEQKLGSAGYEEREAVLANLESEIRRLEEKREREKEAIWADAQ